MKVLPSNSTVKVIYKSQFPNQRKEETEVGANMALDALVQDKQGYSKSTKFICKLLSQIQEETMLLHESYLNIKT